MARRPHGSLDALTGPKRQDVSAPPAMAAMGAVRAYPEPAPHRGPVQTAASLGGGRDGPDRQAKHAPDSLRSCSGLVSGQAGVHRHPASLCYSSASTAGSLAQLYADALAAMHEAMDGVPPMPIQTEVPTLDALLSED